MICATIKYVASKRYGRDFKTLRLSWRSLSSWSSLSYMSVRMMQDPFRSLRSSHVVKTITSHWMIGWLENNELSTTSVGITGLQCRELLQHMGSERRRPCSRSIQLSRIAMPGIILSIWLSIFCGPNSWARPIMIDKVGGRASSQSCPALHWER